MLATLAAAILAGALQAGGPALHPQPDASAADRLFSERAPISAFYRSPSHCRDAVRIQTGFEPALLFRDRDRAAARRRLLIELPPAEACLVAAPEAPEGGDR